MVMIPRLRSLALLGGATSIIMASANSGTIRGQIFDGQGRPVGGAQVRIDNKISGYINTTETSKDGTFVLSNLPSGTYHLEASKEGFGDSHTTIEITASLPIKLSLVLKPNASATVAVTEEAMLIPDTPSSFINVEQNLIETIPSSYRSRGLEQLLMMTPGFMADENGRFHFRGSHGQSTYVMDGMPVTDKIQATFSNVLNPEDLQNIEIITSGIPAEFGGKPVAVFNLTSKSGLGSGDLGGHAAISMGSFNMTETTAQVRGGSDHIGYFVSAAQSKTDRYLDPVNFDNLNNHGSSNRFYTRFDWALDDQNLFKFNLSGGSSSFQIPNLVTQEYRSQNQTQRNEDFNLSTSYVRTLTDRSGLELRSFYRRASSQFNPTESFEPTDPLGGPDYPAWITSNRTLESNGASLIYHRFFDVGEFKSGLEYVAYPIEESLRFFVEGDSGDESRAEGGDRRFDAPNSVLEFEPGILNIFQDSIKPQLLSAFAQFNYHQGPWTFNMGLRGDDYRYRTFKTSETQPRLGMSYRFSDTNSLIRGSYDRLFIIPDNEYLAISSRGSVLKPELQNSLTLGVEQGLGSFGRVQFEYWEKQSVNSADSEQLFNTGVLFPIHVAKGIFRGWNARFDARYNAWSSFLSLGKTRAIFVAPVTGGLRLEEPEFVPGTAFLIDHDQKLSAVFGLRYQKASTYIQLLGRYDSGLVAGDPADGQGSDYAFGTAYIEEDYDSTFGPLYRIKPRTIWNLSVGFRLAEFEKKKIDVSLDALNMFDKKGLYNFLSVFGGTHVIPPRTLTLRIKYQF